MEGRKVALERKSLAKGMGNKTPSQKGSKVQRSVAKNGSKADEWAASPEEMGRKSRGMAPKSKGMGSVLERRRTTRRQKETSKDHGHSLELLAVKEDRGIRRG